MMNSTLERSNWLRNVYQKFQEEIMIYAQEVRIINMQQNAIQGKNTVVMVNTISR